MLIIGRMLELQSEHTKRYFFYPLLAPLRFEDVSVKYGHGIFVDISKGLYILPYSPYSEEMVDETTLSQCVESLHRLMTGLSLSHQFMGMLAFWSGRG